MCGRQGAIFAARRHGETARRLPRMGCERSHSQTKNSVYLAPCVRRATSHPANRAAARHDPSSNLRGSTIKKLSLPLLGLSALATVALAPAAAHADCVPGNCWGAVAYGPRGAWADSYNYPARHIAERVAQNNCGGRCTHMLTFQNSCGAYASGPSARSYYGWGNAMSAGEARAIAMRECNERGPECFVRISACTLR